MSQKPSIPKGTRDFIPEETLKRNYIFDTIKEVFKLYGFLPIETPAMETLDTLMGKYGEEGDKLIFKILNSGDYFSKVSENEINKDNSLKLSSKICEKALRYDLTVPFARFVVQHRNEITFPFKRYQIQPVWRADRPQKGRYREFFQCDVDVVGSDSLINEVELIQIVEEVFKKLGISVTIKINNRKILSGIAEYIGEADKIIDITVAIDKIDKIGIEKVNEELRQKGVPETSIQKLQPVILMTGNISDKMNLLKSIFQESEIGKKGIEEIETVLSYLNELEVETKLDFDISLARGLNYYTGAIFEVKANDVSIGSICGGGRYDNLTGIFGLPDVSGVGISFGADRIYDVLTQLELFPKESSKTTQILFTNFGEKESFYCLKLVNKLRKEGIIAELYPDTSKLKKQMNYANSRNIPYVALVGEDEILNNTISIKDMIDGKQTTITLSELILILKQ